MLPGEKGEWEVNETSETSQNLNNARELTSAEFTAYGHFNITRGHRRVRLCSGSVVAAENALLEVSLWKRIGGVGMDTCLIRVWRIFYH